MSELFASLKEHGQLIEKPSRLNSLHSTFLMAPSAKRGWWRTFFHDHPGYVTRSPESTDSSGKAKVWCKECFEARISTEMGLDERMVVAGTREMVRPRSVIEDMCESSTVLSLAHISRHKQQCGRRVRQIPLGGGLYHEPQR
jgi:hypothetical protein